MARDAVVQRHNSLETRQSKVLNSDGIRETRRYTKAPDEGEANIPPSTYLTTTSEVQLSSDEQYRISRKEQLANELMEEDARAKKERARLQMHLDDDDDDYDDDNDTNTNDNDNRDGEEFFAARQIFDTDGEEFLAARQTLDGDLDSDDRSASLQSGSLLKRSGGETKNVRFDPLQLQPTNVSGSLLKQSLSRGNLSKQLYKSLWRRKSHEDEEGTTLEVNTDTSNTDEVINYEIAQEQLREMMLETLGEEESDEENGFPETIEDEEEPDEENYVLVMKDRNGRPKLLRTGSERIGRGAQLKNRNTFALEVLPKIYIRIVIFAAYLVLLIMFCTDFFLYFTDIDFPFDASVRVNDTLVCYPKNNNDDESCIRDEIITSAQAALLSNTVLVADGVNASEWDGQGAVDGSGPFSTFDIPSHTFIADRSVLEKSANPELHMFWDNITSVLWHGYRGSTGADVLDKISIKIRYTRFEGEWPDEMANEKFPVSVQGYACVRGEDCDNVKNWRWSLIQDYENVRESREVNGNTYTARIYLYNNLFNYNLIDSAGIRFVTSSDPGGAVSACLAQDNCKTSLVVTGIAFVEAYRITDLVTCVLFSLFYMLWVMRIIKLRKYMKWPRDTRWFGILGTGVFLLQIGLVIPTITGVSESDYRFKEGSWLAFYVIWLFGYTMVMFASACFADGPRWYVVDQKEFYAGKLVGAVVIFCISMATAFYRFPKVIGSDQPGTDIQIGRLGYQTSVTNWSSKDQMIFATLTIIRFSVYILGLFWIFWTCIRTRSMLKQLPYVMTRSTQVTYSFITKAIFCWVMLEFIYIIIDVTGVILENEQLSMNGLDGLVLALDSMTFLDGIWTPAKPIFLSTFTAICMYIFLPSTESQNTGTKTHFKSESEVSEAGASNVGYIAVLDRAWLLCRCSREVYLPFNNKEREEIHSACSTPKTDTQRENNRKLPDEVTDKEGKDQVDSVRLRLKAPDDKINMKETHDFHSEAVSSETINITNVPSENMRSYEDSFLEYSEVPKINILRLAGSIPCASNARAGSTYSMGCKLVARVTEPSKAALHDTKLIILRHELSGDIIVAFQGTITNKQVKTDLMISRIGVDLNTFLATTSAKQRLRLEKEEIFSNESLDAMVEKLVSGVETKVKRLADLLPRSEMYDLPEYLQDTCKSHHDIQGCGKIHFGFWSSYNPVRKEIHRIVREELLRRPGRLLITGHSLGGAQAILCAYDMSRWVIPTVTQELSQNSNSVGQEEVDTIKLSCYTFGSPVIGDIHFKRAYNKLVPDTQLIVCDGDIVTASPPSFLGFCHVGRTSVFDETGCIFVQPSFFEKQFHLHRRSKVASHLPASYQKVIKQAYSPLESNQELLHILKLAYGL